MRMLMNTLRKFSKSFDIPWFLNIMWLIKVIHRVFPNILNGAASRWLRNNELLVQIKNLGKIFKLKTKFLNKYCPPGQTTKKMEEINNFKQESDETLFQAWDHFKELLMKCPQYYLTEMQEVILFYNGLDIRHEKFLTQEVPFQLRLLNMQKRPSKKWLNTLKNSIMEHLEEEVLRLLMD
ncbi:retrovirus-related pol polyprotein from transposon TNT 1-94 [Tanacetum coccineum]